MSRSISVVIPNFNGQHLLERNLPLVYEALRYATSDFEVIVSDDNSSDQSVAFLKLVYPQVICLPGSVNEGFSANINKGIRVASKELVLLLNSDVALFPDYFISQLQYFDQPDTFGVMGKIIGLKDDFIQDAAKYPKLNGLKLYTTLNYQPIKGVSKAYQWPSLFLSGANALVDRKKLQLLGGFDEIYSPFYMEDADLGIRAWRMGWKCYYEPDAICRHPASATIVKYHKKREIERISARNRALFHHIHHSPFRLMIWKWLTFVQNGLFHLLPSSAKSEGLADYFKMRKKAEQSRAAFDIVTKTHQKPAKYLHEVATEIATIIGKKPIELF
jgi:GT2 family glycosyltransferase